MKFLDLAGELLAKVDFDESKIILPQKLVFVCGAQSDDKLGPPKSMREILLSKAYAAGPPGEFGGAKVLLAEVAVKALAESSFTNLLDLETYIAAVVQAVILIVESPGSMCELGAFIMVEEISKKLIVVVQGKYKNTPSFITSGAIKYFKEHQPNAQELGYDWETDKATGVITAPPYATDAMLTEIPAAMQQVHAYHAKEKLKRGELGHRIYLTLSFCHLLRAAKLIDIKRCFEFANIDIELNDIRNCIDTLIICNLLKMVPKGKLDYYVARVEKSPLDMRFLPGTLKKDTSQLRWQTLISAAIDDEEKFRNDMFVGHRHA